jgi:hypothetical protein
MFEGQVAYYLNRYLGTYVYGLDPQSLKISVFKGDVVLHNLRLKPEALADLNLPISVKAGLLGTLTLKVWFPPSTVSIYEFKEDPPLYATWNLSLWVSFLSQ